MNKWLHNKHGFYLYSKGKNYFFLLFWCMLYFPLQSQINLTPSTNAQQLIETIVGKGFYVFNASLHCPNGAAGTFVNNGSNIGVSDGIILCTGAINNCVGPNNKPNASLNNGAPGDAHLNSLITVSGVSTYDACALEFDLIPACDTLKINYVFGSEEYPEYVGKAFNDMFGFFISGPGITGVQNIAIVPGTNTATAINSINAGTNSQYFVNNTNGTTVQYDGFTKSLVAKTKVKQCDTFHLKLVVADVGDGIFDSGVLIKGNSIECSPVVYTDMAASVSGLENCNNITVKFCRTGDSAQAYTINYVIGGTATNGVDYQQLPGSITIPANVKCADIPIVPIPDNIIEGQEVITLAYQFGFCPKWDTIKIYMNDPPPFDAGPDVKLCLKDSVQIGILPVGGMTYKWTPTIGLSNPNISNPKVFAGTFIGSSASSYTLTGTSTTTGCVFTDSLKVKVNALPFSNFNVGTDFCVGQVISLRDTSKGVNGSAIIAWYWEYNNLINTQQNPQIVYQQPIKDTIRLTVTDDNGCKDDTFKIVNIWPKPDAKFTIKSACAGDSVFFTNLSTVPNGGVLSQSIWNFGDSSPLLINSAPLVGHIYPTTANVYNVELIITTDKGCANSYKNIVYLNPKPKASFKADTVCLYNRMRFTNLSMSDNSFWNFGDGQSSTFSNPTHQYNAPGTYTVSLVASSNFGCKDSVKHTVLVYDVPKFTFLAADTAGCPYFCTTFTSIKDPASVPISSWLWDFGTGDKEPGPKYTYCYKNSGKYSPALIAVSDKGCMDTVVRSLLIHVYPVPTANFNLSNAGDLSTYEPVANIINNSSADVTVWNWNFGDGTTGTIKDPPPHIYPNPTSYTITLAVQNKYGCKDTTWRGLLVTTDQTIYIPNTFTPNEDARNEKFQPYCAGDYYENANYVMYIFNRFGENIFVSKKWEEGWDGRYKGDVCQEGVYIYQCFFFSKEDNSLLAKFRGTVNLVR